VRTRACEFCEAKFSEKRDVWGGFGNRRKIFSKDKFLRLKYFFRQIKKFLGYLFSWKKLK